jgi:hypothetical protein
VLTAKAHSYSDNELICFIKHSNSVGKLEADYLELNVTEPLPDDFNCVKVVAEYVEEYYSGQRKDATKKKNISEEKFNECFLPKLKEYDAANSQMKSGIIYESKTLTDEEKLDSVLKDRNEFLAFYSKILRACDAVSNYIDAFVKKMKYKAYLMEPHNISEEEFYCARKYVVEKNIIDTNVYNVSLNPTNFDTTNLNCDRVFNINDAIEELKINQINSKLPNDPMKCIMEKTTTKSLVELRIGGFVLNELNLSEEQKKVEQDNMELLLDK